MFSMKCSNLIIWAVSLCTAQFSFAQFENILGGSVMGNIESTFQYYAPDSTINAQVPPSKTGLNSFANINYSIGKFRAGVRFESYLPALLGYPARFNGTGLGYRYAGYSNDFIEVTVGNFYDQFGSGMVFRAFEERQLGLDNAMDGIHLKIRPYKGIELTGLIGKQRYEFNSQLFNGPGTVRAVNLDVDFSTIFPKLLEKGWQFTVGGSFVSKFQTAQSPILILPENVAAYAARFKVVYKGFNFNAEGVLKENDPSVNNGYIYKNGYGILANFGYSQKGLGILVQAKAIDNMSFRSDRTAQLTDLQINFLPALTKTHTYNLAATLYPYATIPNGEVAFQGDIFYTFAKETLLGGKYGTKVSVNFSTVYDVKRNIIERDSFLRGYTSTPFVLNPDSLFFRDFNIEISKKFSKNLSMKFIYFNQAFNASANIVAQSTGYIYTNIAVVDMTYKINKKHSIRAELQGLWTQQDQGDWATLVVEYTISPNWTIGIIDQWNYGNKTEEKRVHYLLATLSYIKGSTRLMLNVGKQRAGIFCVGGICRQVPASNGVTVSFTHSF
jgi:hypothetical protein